MYEINTVYFDVPQAHLMEAVRVQLDQLERASFALSDAVRDRIAEYRARMCDLKQRIDIAQNKIKQIAEMKKAVVIYSPGSYPVPKELRNENFRCLFPGRSLIETKELDECHRYKSTEGVKLSENLQFFTVKAYDTEKPDFYENPPRGLGSRKDRNLTSVADILLFNTLIDPYCDPDSTEPLKSDDEADTKNPEPIPDSDATIGFQDIRDPGLSSDEDDFPTYDPGSSSFPGLSLPDNLPRINESASDLPDLVSDHSYYSVTTPQKSMRPRADVIPKDREQLLLPDIDSPPPIDVVTVDLSLNSTPSPSKAPVLSSSIPPPPPPPPMAPPAPVRSMPPAKKNPPAVIETDRNSLLNAIRNHNGIRGLKSTSSRPDTPKRGGGDGESSKAPMSHMEKLKEHLKNRSCVMAAERKAPDVAGIPDIFRATLEEKMKGVANSSESSSSSDDNNEEWK